MCLLFKVHQEAPGDLDQVQPPAPPPALFGSLNLACPGPHLQPHAPGGSPLSPWTRPGSHPQMASSSPASSSHPCFCQLDPSDSGARGNRNAVDDGNSDEKPLASHGIRPWCFQKDLVFLSWLFYH